MLSDLKQLKCCKERGLAGKLKGCWLGMCVVTKTMRQGTPNHGQGHIACRSFKWRERTTDKGQRITADGKCLRFMHYLCKRQNATTI